VAGIIPALDEPAHLAEQPPQSGKSTRPRFAPSSQLEEAITLTQEVQNIEMRRTASAYLVFEHREGTHDDLVLAVASPAGGSGCRAL